MITLQLEYNNKFSCALYNNNNLIKKSDKNFIHNFKIEKIPAHIKIEIHPWKIQPIVRINNIMVNYGLAKITPWDHMLEFKIKENFEDEYFENIIKSKKEYLKIGSKEVMNIMGLDQSYNDVIDKIKRNIT